jgi:hypothetical protein
MNQQTSKTTGILNEGNQWWDHHPYQWIGSSVNATGKPENL